MAALPVKTAKPPGGNPGVIFDKSTGVRVLDATRYVEGMRKNQVPARRGGGGPGGGGGALYRLTATLSAATSLAAVTSASALPQKLTGTTLADASGTVTLYNYHDKTFASSAIVWASLGTGGKLWVIDVRSCTNVS